MTRTRDTGRQNGDQDGCAPFGNPSWSAQLGKSGIAPGLLLASPHLKDPNFEKSVVLMIEHHEQGALGMIVNRPTRVSVSSVLYAANIDWEGDSKAVLWDGGPVMQESCWLLHESVELGSSRGSIEIGPGMIISSSAERLRELAKHPPPRLRFLRGVASWGPSQLDEELSSGFWIHTEASLELLFEASPAQMWRRAYQEMGIDPAFLIHGEGVH